ncbi:MAG: GntR family transcriptional regulator [Rhizobiaceae bacterium]|nr:GntR family transcriptional regulator [Rhizobiaceae bacterium]
MSASSERAYAHIKAAILSGGYRSGSRLTEDMVASELGLSRTPVRDAFRRLQAEQLISITPYSGARVASWSHTELREVAQMRAMLESFAAGLAAAKRSDEDVERMNELCARMEKEAARSVPDLDRISADNLAFHRTIVEAANNTRLGACLEPLWNYPVVVRKYGLFGRERLLRSLSHHKEIVAAIEKGDQDWAEAIMRVHILAARSFDAALSLEAEDQADDEARLPATID